MSEQLRISSFYRSSKTGDALPAKKRRSETQQQDKEVPLYPDVVSLPAPQAEITKIKSKITSKTSKNEYRNRHAKNAGASGSYTIVKSFGKQLTSKNLAETITECKPQTATSQDTTAAVEVPTSFSDDHGCNHSLANPTTPTHSLINACNTRKRKLAGSEECTTDDCCLASPLKQPHCNEKKTTEEKNEPVDLMKPRTPSSVRKKLLLFDQEISGKSAVLDGVATQMGNKTIAEETTQLSSTEKAKPTVLFQYKGILSPRKNAKILEDAPKSVLAAGNLAESHVTPKKEPCESVTLAKKSPAVKSLASLLTPTKESPKKLTPEQVKAQLGKCGKLADLKARLSAINNGAAKLKEFQEKNKDNLQLKKFSSIQLDVAVPISPQKVASPQKASEALPKTPAFERFHTLAQPSIPSLHLPFKFKYLAEVFRSVDTVVGLLHNRREIVTFQKLKSGVQQMMRRNFSEAHLGQICRVFPTAYRLVQEKRRVAYGSLKKEEYDLTITPSLSYLTSALVEDDSTLAETLVNPNCKEDHSFRALGPSALLERKNIFHNRLLRIVKQYHKDFLSTLDPPLVVPEEKLTRWHPAFNVDDVPDIKPLPLPKAPNFEVCSKAKDILEKARTLFSHVPTIDAALQPLSNANESLPTVSNKDEASKPVVAQALKGISSSLLEKVRAREASRLAATLTRKPEEEKERKTLLRLPELTRLLRSIFVTERRNTLTMELVVARLTDSWTSPLTPAEIEAHIRLLAKELPEWLSVPVVSGVPYVKFNKTLDINHLIEKLLGAQKTLS